MPIYERMTIQGRGGALPQYQSNQTPYVPGQGVTARLSDARGQLEGAGQQAKYKALAGLGKAVDSAVDVGLQAYEDYSKTKATELVTKYKMGMRQSMYGEGGILTREGENAFTANADTMKRSKELRAELLKDMSGSRVEQIFNKLIDPEEAEYSLKAQEYEGKQYKTYQTRTYTAAAKDSAERAITSFASPKEFAKNTGESLYHQKRLLELDGYSGEALDRGLKESSSKIFAGGIEQALAADDLASARRLLAEGSREWRPPVPHDLSKVGGVVEKGNIDINNRKVEHRPDGSIATVESFSFNFDGVEVLIPTVIDGKKVSNDEAIAHFMKTGEHLGKFKTPEAATEYAIKLHENHAIQYGEPRTRMTADDIAKAKKAIKVKAEAQEKKWEAEKAKADFKAAADKVTTILDSAEDEKAALEQVEKLAGDDAEKRDLYMKAWDSVTKQRKVDAARKQTAEDNAFFSGLDDRVKDMSAQELTGYILGLTDPDHQKGAKLAWERQHGQAPVVLVSDEVHLQQVYDDVAKGQKSVDRILLEHDGHISDEDAMKVRQAAAKAGAEKAKEVEKMKVELVTKKDDMKPFLKTLKLDGSKLSDEQLRKKNLFMYAAQDRINGFISTHKRPPSYEEKVKLLDELTVEVVKGGWFTPDTLAYELYESEPPRGANLPERAVWQYLPGEKRWTWVDPVSGAAMKKEDVERAKGGF